MTQKMRSYLFFPVISSLAGGAAAILIRNDTAAFGTIEKPFFTPPPAAFPIVWSALYILMGISAARVAQTAGPTRENGLALFAIQLVVNFFWPLIFFSLQEYVFASVWLVLLFVTAACMTAVFYRADPAAAWLQLPYLLWLAFAFVLNIGVVLLNR